MQTETTALTKKEAAPLTMFQADDTTVDFDTSDILIPKILLMQGLSQLVSEGKAAQGDMVNSVTNEVLGNKTKGVTFAPITTFKTMTVMRNKDGKYVFDHAEPWSAKHVSYSWEVVENGQTYRNYPTLNFYVMLEEDLKKESAMPVLLAFRSTSLKAGKKVINYFAQAADIGKKPCAAMLTLMCNIVKNEKGIFHVFDIKFEKETPANYGPKILRWEKLLKTAKVVVDTSGDEKEVEADVDTKVTANSQF